MDNQRQQAAERIKQANNILVTVSNNPSVDQLAACIGLTLSLNKMGKHATAVFSGQVPSTLEFLQPEKTIERNTDSLRDFIIALDKSKADKLRYKVEDKMVRIFITPYRTSINEKDLEFSQGDFNVDVVVAIGVHNQADLDQAITTHGRILHDATIVTLNVKPGGEIGTINWLDPNASSLSELGVQLIGLLDKRLMDGQIATSFLTGIVAETDRFSNSKTSPQTMTVSAELMAAGANQQLVATKLEEPAPVPPSAPLAKQGAQAEPKAIKKPDDGTLEITHEDKSETKSAGVKPENKPEDKAPKPLEIPEIPEEKAEVTELPKPDAPQPPPPAALPEPVVQEMPTSIPEPAPPQVHIDEHGTLAPTEPEVDEGLLPPVRPHEPPTISRHNESPKMVLEPPVMGEAGLPGIPMQEGGLPPSMQEDLPSTAPAPPPSAMAGGDEPQNAPGTSFLGDQPLAPGEEPKKEDKPKVPGAGETLSDIERDVHSTHLDGAGNATDQPLVPPALSPSPSVQPSPVSVISPTGPEPAVPSDGAIPDLPIVSPPAPSPMGMPGPGPSLSPAAPMPTTPPAPFESPIMAPAPQPPLPARDGNSGPAVDSARDAVAQAISGNPNPALEPIQALNSQPVNLPFGSNDAATPSTPPWTPPNDDAAGQNSGPVVSPAQPNSDQSPPPPVPPPMIPPAA
jgi:hypothetical protein